MVVRLAETLGLPLRERNDLLLSAGFAPAYPQTTLTDCQLAPVMDALRRILVGHQPYPAIVVDRFGDLVAANDAFGLLTEGVAAELVGPPLNAYRLALHPRGLAPRIVNFAEWAHHVLDGLRAQASRSPHPRLAGLLAELDAYVPDTPLPPDHLGFAVPLRLRPIPGSAPGTDELRLMTTVSTFATAVDVTVAELRLEAFLPADQATADLLTAAAVAAAAAATRAAAAV